MEEGRVPRKVLNGKFYNTRPVGGTQSKMGGRSTEGY